MGSIDDEVRDYLPQNDRFEDVLNLFFMVENPGIKEGMICTRRRGDMRHPIEKSTYQSLIGMMEKLENAFQADVICIYGPISSELVTNVYDTIEDAKKKRKLSERIVVLLTTNGGDSNSTERIADTFHSNYKEVEFVIPDHAYSAGTILCMSGDRIWMNYHSVLGPIDPQVPNKEGRFVPATGYLEKIGELIEKAKKNTISQAEFLILKDFDLAELSLYEQARDLTVDLLIKWLTQYKFKNWTVRETTKEKVTWKDKEERAKEIAKALGDYKKWKSHGRPLSMETLRELKLQIDDFGQESEKAALIVDFHQLLEDYMDMIGTEAIVFAI